MVVSGELVEPEPRTKPLTTNHQLPTNASSVAVEDLDGDVARPGKRVRQPIRPLDREDAPMQLLEPQIVSGGSFEAIEIGVIQRQAPASILVNERECRAADLLWIETESSR